MEYYGDTATVSKELRTAVEDRVARSLTDYEWKAITSVIFYERPYHLLDDDIDYDMKRIRRLIELIGK